MRCASWATVSLMISVMIICRAVANEDAGTRAALVNLFRATGNYTWLNKTGWNTVAPYCTWYGISCDTNLVYVTSINLMSNNLTGSIPSLSALSRSLTLLQISKNAISGSVPDMSGFSQLSLFDLRNNNFQGTLPDTWAKLANLNFLYLGSNPRLSGKLPSSISNATKLLQISLELTNMTDPFPDFSRMTSLNALYLYNMRLTGTIPPQWFLLPNIALISLSSNSLTGTIPATLCSATKLSQLNIDSNQLSGTVPSCMANLAMLNDSKFSYNSFTGLIPVPVGGRPITNYFSCNAFNCTPSFYNSSQYCPATNAITPLCYCGNGTYNANARSGCSDGSRCISSSTCPNCTISNAWTNLCSVVPTTAAPTTNVPTTPVPTTVMPTVTPTTPAPTTVMPTTTTVMPTTVVITTTAPTTVVPTTSSPTTETPTTVPITTQPPTTEQPTTIPPTTEPPTTIPITTEPPTTVPITTEPPTTIAPTTQPPTVTTRPSFPTTAAQTTELPTTAAPTTSTPTTVVPITTAPPLGSSPCSRPQLAQNCYVNQNGTFGSIEGGSSIFIQNSTLIIKGPLDLGGIQYTSLNSTLVVDGDLLFDNSTVISIVGASDKSPIISTQPIALNGTLIIDASQLGDSPVSVVVVSSTQNVTGDFNNIEVKSAPGDCRNYHYERQQTQSSYAVLVSSSPCSTYAPFPAWLIAVIIASAIVFVALVVVVVVVMKKINSSRESVAEEVDVEF